MKIWLNWVFAKKKPVKLLLRIRKKVFGILKEHKAEGFISYTFSDGKLLYKLNKKFRGKNKTTDVLSFEFGEGGNILADVYISIPRAKDQAKKYNVSLENEIERLAMHGTLHVLGYSHREMEV